MSFTRLRTNCEADFWHLVRTFLHWDVVLEWISLFCGVATSSVGTIKKCLVGAIGKGGRGKHHLRHVVVVTERVLAIVVLPQQRHQQVQRLHRRAAVTGAHVRRGPDLSNHSTKRNSRIIAVATATATARRTERKQQKVATITASATRATATTPTVTVQQQQHQHWQQQQQQRQPRQ